MNEVDSADTLLSNLARLPKIACDPMRAEALRSRIHDAMGAPASQHGRHGRSRIDARWRAQAACAGAFAALYVMVVVQNALVAYGLAQP